MATETPAQTYQRIFGKPWPGGTSTEIKNMLKALGITAAPGSASANLALQSKLLSGWRPGTTSTPSVQAPPPPPASTPASSGTIIQTGPSLIENVATTAGNIPATKLTTSSSPTPAPAPAPAPAPSTSSSKLNVQTSIVDYLKSIGQPSDFAYRSQLAKKYGINNYSGTASQNAQLLNLIKQQTPTGTVSSVSSEKSTSTPSAAAAPTSTQKLNVETSVVDYLKSIGQPSDFASRSALASKFGITNYTGTAEQNTKLLNLLKQQGVPSQSTSPEAISSVTQASIQESTPISTPTSTTSTSTPSTSTSEESEAEEEEKPFTPNWPTPESPEFTLAKNYIINLARSKVHKGIASVAAAQEDPSELKKEIDKTIEDLELPEEVKSLINKFEDPLKSSLNNIYKDYYSKELNEYQDLLDTMDVLSPDQRAHLFKQHTIIKTEYDDLMNKIKNALS